MSDDKIAMEDFIMKGLLSFKKVEKKVESLKNLLSKKNEEIKYKEW